MRQDFDGARAQASEAIVLCQELDNPRGIAWSLDVFAGLLAAGGHADRAARLWGASDALLQRVGGALNPTVAWIRDRYFEPVKMSLGPGIIVRDGPCRGTRDVACAGGRSRTAVERSLLLKSRLRALRV